jgi:hypothetical protein
MWRRIQDQPIDGRGGQRPVLLEGLLLGDTPDTA